ncbi:MAG: hypothetical protein ACTSYE_01990 [Alphaproteobacteria bacterium]
MKRTTTGFGWPMAATLGLMAAASAGGAGAMAAEHVTSIAAGATVLGLRQAGWTVTDQQERIEHQPGLPPYEEVDRVILTTTFVLEKDGKRMRCRLAYDSQMESFSEACATAE